MTGAWVAQGIYTATKLGIVDALSGNAMNADAIAERVDANPDAVNRLMRMLASRGVFTQRRGGKFALTALSNVLRTDAADSMRGLVLFWGDPLHWEHWGRLTHSVRMGRPSVDELRGEPTFEFLGDEPELAVVFNDAMTGLSDMESPWVVSAYDFSRYDTIVDVGDGHGRLLAAILRKWPGTRGILFDAKSVVAGAPTVLNSMTVSDRCDSSADRFSKPCPRVVTLMCSSTSFMTGTTTNRFASCATCVRR